MNLYFVQQKISRSPDISIPATGGTVAGEKIFSSSREHQLHDENEIKTLFDELEKEPDDIQWNVVMEILCKSNHYAKLKSDTGDYPLHYACLNEAPEEVVLKIVELYPEATQHKHHRNGDYPLHDACWKQSETVVLELIKLFPEAAKCNNNFSCNYPLHIACRRNQPETVIKKLVQLCPEALQKKNNSFEFLPVQEACAWNASLSLIKLLVFCYPAALDIVDQQNRTLLDLARKPLVYRAQVDENVEWLNGIDVNKLVRKFVVRFFGTNC